MSRTISVVMKYKNGRRAQRGWHCPKNADMVANTFTYFDFVRLGRKLKQDIKGRGLMPTVDIFVNVSGSLGQCDRVCFEAGHHDWDSPAMFKRVHAILLNIKKEAIK